MLDEATIGVITIGLVEVVKRYGLPKKYSPLVAILVAVALGMLAYGWERGLVVGATIGLSSAGAYDVATKTFKK